MISSAYLRNFYEIPHSSKNLSILNGKNETYSTKQKMSIFYDFLIYIHADDFIFPASN